MLTGLRLRDNVAAFDRYKILPRSLRNVKDIDTSTFFFGHKVGDPPSTLYWCM